MRTKEKKGKKREKKDRKLTKAARRAKKQAKQAGPDVMALRDQLTALTARVAALEAQAADVGAAPADVPAQPVAASLTTVSGIGFRYAERLRDAGVTSIADLVAADSEALAGQTGIPAKSIQGWIDAASASQGAG